MKSSVSFCTYLKNLNTHDIWNIFFWCPSEIYLKSFYFFLHVNKNFILALWDQIMRYFKFLKRLSQFGYDVYFHQHLDFKEFRITPSFSVKFCWNKVHFNFHFQVTETEFSISIFSDMKLQNTCNFYPRVVIKMRILCMLNFWIQIFNF